MTPTARIDPGNASREEHLDWQFDFLRASLERYEAGHEYEAQRVAVVIRILCHDTTWSASLLGQLGLINTWRWLDTSRTLDDPAEPTIWGPLVFESPHLDGAPAGVRFAAPLGVPTRSSDASFLDWWTSPVLKDSHSRFSRKDLVNFVANEDGGAHVDPELTERYHAISRGWSMGYPGRTADPRRVVRTPVWEFIRQVGFEVQFTAHRADPDRFGEPTGRTNPSGYVAVQVAWVGAKADTIGGGSGQPGGT